MIRQIFAVLMVTWIGGVPTWAAEAPVDATAAYREAYGPPPKTEAAGRCLAAVVFLPGVGTSGDPGGLSPLPLFSLQPDRVMEEAARVVVEGYPNAGRLLALPRAFPEGTRLLSATVRENVATVRVEVPSGELHPLGRQALAYTLTQFPEVTGVVLEVQGRGPGEELAPEPGLVEPPPPPRLLDVVSSVHPGEEPEQIDVLFDRPVDVETFAIRLRDGTGLPGETYVSMFDMAIVYRPEDPEIIREGLPLHLEWAVRDKTGRSARGERDVPLRIFRQVQ